MAIVMERYEWWLHMLEESETMVCVFSDDMSYSSNKILIPEIFENPLSKVRMVRSYCNPAAAIIASGSVIFFFCFNVVGCKHV